MIYPHRPERVVGPLGQGWPDNLRRVQSTDGEDVIVSLAGEVCVAKSVNAAESSIGSNAFPELLKSPSTTSVVSGAVLFMLSAHVSIAAN